MDDIEEKLNSNPQPPELQSILELIDSKPGELSAYEFLLKGRTLFLLQNDDEALKCFKQAIELDDTLFPAYYFGGIVSRYLEKTHEAVELLTKAADLITEVDSAAKSSRANYCRELANALMSVKKHEEAEVAYRRAVEEEKTFAALSALGACLMSQKKDPATTFAEALQTVEGPLGESHINCLYNLGMALFQKGDWENSVENFKKVVQIQPQDFSAICKIIQGYSALKKSDERDLYIDLARELRRNGLAPARFCREQIRVPDVGNILCYEYFEFSGEFGSPFYLMLWENGIGPEGSPKYVLAGSYDDTNNLHPNLENGHRLWHLDAYYPNQSHATLGMMTCIKPDFDAVKDTLVDALCGNATPISSSSPAQ